MTRHFKRPEPGFLIVLVISIIALWPFIGRASLPEATDAELHIFRLAELSYLVRSGEIYPRWAPNFYHGYGYPIFNYYAPLTYYLGLIVELMPRLDAVAGIKFVFVLGLLFAAGGTYGFVRDNWGRPAGWVAAAVYLYAPYVQYIDPHARGALAEAFSLGMFPVALWLVDRLRRQPTAWRLVTAVLAVAALILSHNLMALLFFSILFAWAVWHAIVAWGTGHRGPRWPFVALFLGLLLAAFFWLPVALERNEVNLTTLLGAGDNYDFRTHFLSLWELLRLSLWLDWGASEPAFRFNLGVAQWVLGGMGLILIVLHKNGNGKTQNIISLAAFFSHVTFFVVGFLLLLFLMLPVSTFVWERMPLLPYFQFPWRLLGAADFMLAVLAGAGISRLLANRGRWGQSAVLVTGVALPLLLGLPLSQPAPWPDFGPVTQLRMNRIEHHGRWLGTTSTADYVPVTVDIAPPPNPEVVRGFFEGRPLDRVNRATVPEDAVVEAEYIRPLFTRYQVSTPISFRLRLFQFDYPGWHVQIDGEEVETELGRPEGFIVIPVPAGEHIVEVRFGTTPARTIAWIISGLAFVLTGVSGWWIRKRTPPRESPRPFSTAERVAFGVAMGISVVFIAVLQPLNLLHANSTDNEVLVAETAVSGDFGRQISLLAYDTSARQVAPGDTLFVNIYWKAQRPLDINYQSFVHVLSPEGALVAQSDNLNPGDFPTRRWTIEKYVRDEHILRLPADLSPGTYTVSAGLWVQAEGWRLPLLDPGGAQIDDKIAIFSIQVQQ